MSEPRVVLKPGREKPFRQGHPWVFSGAVARIEGEPAPGDPAALVAGSGEFLGRGFVNPRSQIVLRVATRADEPLDAAFLRRRIAGAIALRERHLHGAAGVRLVNAEGDYLPGLVVDRYADFLCVQILSAGLERLKPTLLEVLSSLWPARGVYERSDAPLRKEEGLPPARGVLSGEPPPPMAEFEEAGIRFGADLASGQKTGFYLDQRNGRALCRSLASGADVLDVFSYTGAFAVSAAAGGASSLTLVEDNAAHLETASAHLLRNGFDTIPRELHAGDAFRILRDLRGAYDLIVLDPPPFARSRAHVERAARGYKDVNRLALGLLRPEGHLLTFSCSHHVDPHLFQQIVFSAAVESGREVEVVARLGQPPDHPFSIHHPQGEYLKGLSCRAL